MTAGAAGEFVTWRSSPTSADPEAVERFVAVDAAAERGWAAWAARGVQWQGRLTQREYAKLAYLAGWHARDLGGG